VGVADLLHDRRHGHHGLEAPSRTTPAQLRPSLDVGVCDLARESVRAAVGLTCEHHRGADTVGGLDVEEVVVVLAGAMMSFAHSTEVGVVVHEGRHTQAVLHLEPRFHPCPVRQDGGRTDNPRGAFDGPWNAQGDTCQGRHPVALAQLLDLFAGRVKTGHWGGVDVKTDVLLANDVARLVADRYPEVLVTEVDRAHVSGARHCGEDRSPSAAPGTASHRGERAVDDSTLGQKPCDRVSHGAGGQACRPGERGPRDPPGAAYEGEHVLTSAVPRRVTLRCDR